MSSLNFSDESILTEIVNSLSPSENQYNLAISKYEAVAKYLAEDSGVLGDVNPKLYPQGSFAIGTPNQPTTQTEFDFDFVCEADLNPFDLLSLIKNRLEENGLYDGDVELKNRCVRLYYKNDFYLDILPAQPDSQSSSGNLLIPDRKSRRLVSSNPKEYVRWFTESCHKQATNERPTKVFAEFAPQFLTAKQKSILQRSTQLIKRHRDIFFKDSYDLAPASIILTTLAGTLYQNQQSTLEALSYILEEVQKMITTSPKLLRVENPSNSDEILTEKWAENPKSYGAFKEWVDSFSLDLDFLATTQGIHKKNSLLCEMFGEELAKKALRKCLIKVSSARQNKTLGIKSTGVLTANATASATRVPTNTFFGGEEEE